MHHRSSDKEVMASYGRQWEDKKTVQFAEAPAQRAQQPALQPEAIPRSDCFHPGQKRVLQTKNGPAALNAPYTSRRQVTAPAQPSLSPSTEKLFTHRMNPRSKGTRSPGRSSIPPAIDTPQEHVIESPFKAARRRYPFPPPLAARPSPSSLPI